MDRFGAALAARRRKRSVRLNPPSVRNPAWRKERRDFRARSGVAGRFIVSTSAGCGGGKFRCLMSDDAPCADIGSGRTRERHQLNTCLYIVSKWVRGAKLFPAGKCVIWDFDASMNVNQWNLLTYNRKTFQNVWNSLLGRGPSGQERLNLNNRNRFCNPLAEVD